MNKLKRKVNIIIGCLVLTNLLAWYAIFSNARDNTPVDMQAKGRSAAISSSDLSALDVELIDQTTNVQGTNVVKIVLFEFN